MTQTFHGGLPPPLASRRPPPIPDPAEGDAILTLRDWPSEPASDASSTARPGTDEGRFCQQFRLGNNGSPTTASRLPRLRRLDVFSPVPTLPPTPLSSPFGRAASVGAAGWIKKLPSSSSFNPVKAMRCPGTFPLSHRIGQLSGSSFPLRPCFPRLRPMEWEGDSR